MKSFKLGIVTLIILLIVACSKQNNNYSLDFDMISENHPDTNQQYSIINTFDLYDSYFKRSFDNLEQEKINQIYRDEIIGPVYESCFADGEYIYMAEFLLENAPTNKSELLKVIKETNTENLHNNIFEALIKSSNHLSTNEQTTVCVFPNTDQDVPVMITTGAGIIIVLYNNEYSEELIKVSLAHEYHHSIWTERYIENAQTATILDNIVFEGKAVMFEEIVYPGNTLSPVSPSYILSFWEMIETDLDKTDLDRTLEILYGDGKLPYLYGYSEGYKIVKSYLDKNPNLTLEEWLSTDAQVIFEQGEYLSNYH